MSNSYIDIKATVLFVILPLSLGLLIYLTGRDDNVIIVKWIGKLAYIKMPNWVNYNLPDGLYSFALMSTSTLIWSRNNQSKIKKIWEIILILFLLAYEILQKYHIINGTFDILDIIFIIIFIILYFFISRILDKQNK
jgi:hypothetical protein